MKIRHQFVLLLVALAAIPISYFVGHAVYDHFFISKQTLFDKTNEIHIVKGMNLSAKDKEILLSTIRNRPRDVEEAFVFIDGTIIASTIPEFENLDSIDVEEFMKLATNPDDGALYQVVTLPAESSEQPMLHIAKFDEDNFYKHRRDSNEPEYTRYLIIIFSMAVEIICVIFAAFISHRISSSITFLERNTELLADGKFETPILVPKSFLKSNEITALSENLETLRIALKDNQRRRDRLIMGVSHDLRTPIAIIKGYSEAMADGLIQDKEKVKDALSLIQRKTEKLDEMVETLLDFLKLNSMEWRKNFTEMDLSEFLEERAKVSKATCEIFKRNFVSSRKIPKGTMVKMDATLVERTLMNLLSNAIRYSNDGDTIYTNSFLKDDVAEVSIRDTGIGIPEEDLNQIFDMFYRASHSRCEEGMGIGLAVVKNIVETHGWNIRVESELGKGTTFTITIPVKAKAQKKRVGGG